MKKPFTGPRRTLLQVLVALVGLGLLAVPPVVLTLSDVAASDVLWAALRLAALEAFTLVFIDIVTGAFRPFFVRVYKGRTVQRAHVAMAAVGLALGLAHGPTLGGKEGGERNR